MTLEEFNREAGSIATAIAVRKERAMIYQADAKERLAIANGLLAGTYYLLPYRDWLDVQKATQA